MWKAHPGHFLDILLTGNYFSIKFRRKNFDSDRETQTGTALRRETAHSTGEMGKKKPGGTKVPPGKSF